MNSWSESAGAQMLVSSLFLGDAVFGIDTAHIQEIVRVGHITPVHRAPSYVLGVINLRGRIATVIDLGAKLGLRPVERHPDNRIFIVVWQGETLGLLVDRVGDARTIDADAVQPIPENVSSVQTKYLSCVFRDAGRMVALLQLAPVLAAEESVDP